MLAIRSMTTNAIRVPRVSAIFIRKSSIGNWKSLISNDACNQCGDGMTTNSTGCTSPDDCTCASAFTVRHEDDNGKLSCLCLAGYGLKAKGCDICAVGQYREGMGGGGGDVTPRCW